jgi:hypothetical protein
LPGVYGASAETVKRDAPAQRRAQLDAPLAAARRLDLRALHALSPAPPIERRPVELAHVLDDPYACDIVELAQLGRLALEFVVKCPDCLDAGCLADARQFLVGRLLNHAQRFRVLGVVQDGTDAADVTVPLVNRPPTARATARMGTMNEERNVTMTPAGSSPGWQDIRRGR